MAPSTARSHSSTDSGTLRATLPIDVSGGLFLDPKAARAIGESLAAHYTTNTPYPHIVIDDFLPATLTEEILAHFPPEPHDKTSAEFALNYSGIQKNKRQIFPNDCDVFSRNLFGFFNAAPFLQFLEGLTQIPALISDPYFNGGGFHETYTGGKLGIHADFRINEQLHLARRLNVIIYLNKDWPPEYGGNLEIWDKSMQHKVHSIAPLFNRCVVFNTDATSYHGHPEPLACPPNRSRKSVALYYYTASPAIYSEVPSASTMYVSRPTDGAHERRQARKLRMQNYAKDFVPPILFRGVRALKKQLCGR